jgi:hypothetical protein
MAHLDGHPLGVEPADLGRSRDKAAHQKPALIPLGRQPPHPPHHDVLLDAVVLAVIHLTQELADALMHRIVQQFAGVGSTPHMHVGLDADDVIKAIPLAEAGQFGPAKAPVGQKDHLLALGDHAREHQQQRFLKGIAALVPVIDVLVARGPAQRHRASLEYRRGHEGLKFSDIHPVQGDDERPGTLLEDFFHHAPHGVCGFNAVIVAETPAAFDLVLGRPDDAPTDVGQGNALGFHGRRDQHGQGLGLGQTQRRGADRDYPGVSSPYDPWRLLIG